MSSVKYQKRFYRDACKPADLCQIRVVVKETDVQIMTERPVDKGLCERKLEDLHRQIHSYISRDPRFLTALRPLPVERSAAPIIKQMSIAARRAGVGPMAAVAGAVAQSLGRELLRRNYREVIIENGGDIFLKTTRPRLIGIYAGSSRVFNRLFLKPSPTDTPLGICTSSGTVGHSLSFGLADAAVVISNDAALADAVATATANLVRSRQDLEKAVAFARSVKGVSGVVVIIKKYLVSWGNITFAA